MIVGETYFIRDKHKRVFIGRVNNIYETTTVVDSYCNCLNQYVSAHSTHSMPTEWIVFYFKLSDLREGIRYRFIDINNTTFDANFLSFSNYHLRLNHYNFESPNATHTTPIFFIKNIELID